MILHGHCSKSAQCCSPHRHLELHFCRSWRRWMQVRWVSRAVCAGWTVWRSSEKSSLGRVRGWRMMDDLRSYHKLCLVKTDRLRTGKWPLKQLISVDWPINKDDFPYVMSVYHKIFAQMHEDNLILDKLQWNHMDPKVSTLGAKLCWAEDSQDAIWFRPKMGPARARFGSDIRS